MDINVRTKRDEDKFCQDGYFYIFDRFSVDKSRKFWRCERKKDCKARLHTDAVTSNVEKIVDVYSHDSNAARVEVLKTITALKRRATESNEGTSQLIINCVQNLSQAAQGQLPPLPAIRKLERRQRVRVQAPPPIPASLEHLIIPADL